MYIKRLPLQQSDNERNGVSDDEFNNEFNVEINGITYEDNTSVVDDFTTSTEANDFNR